LSQKEEAWGAREKGRGVKENLVKEVCTREKVFVIGAGQGSQRSGNTRAILKVAEQKVPKTAWIEGAGPVTETRLERV